MAKLDLQIIYHYLKENNLHTYFEDTTLVPVPRSSPQVDGAVYPSLIIAENLVKNGIGNSVTDCLSRTEAIAKSSSKFSADQRNSVSTHLNSLKVKPLIISEPTIIIVDDILTLGRTAYASALLLKETYPDKEIKIFCPMRTRSFNEPESLTDIRRDFLRAGLNDNVQLPD
ncbi:hypothetical protein SAMN05421594_2744 [Chryseobacterium oleae]|uniref:Phosphoribosyl transferase domain-containing protein n=1 Tax=Chryseobacterium oleae TaxID=491207 RepID=A0A1I4YY76_CHROL|nr:phosphoribosyltransferase [Chryseobacterium oleae]SFN42600.1 hypothetical protein SAMN05421594_2744 [Chryseobacterium oleae]